MKYLWLCSLLFPIFAEANEHAAETAAIDAATGKAIEFGVPFTSPANQFRQLIDTKNLRAELGPTSAVMFSPDDDFHLLRGSVVLESRIEREVLTVNAKMRFQGKIAVSYDYREESTSIFVLFGTASLKNAHTANSQQALARHQGATLIANGFYPSIVRNLDFNMVYAWFARYGWTNEKTKDYVSGLPSPADVRKLASVGLMEERKQHTKNKLFNYFPTIQSDAGPKLYEKRFTTSAIIGKEHTKLEQDLSDGNEITEISPEQAAVIVLPEINLGPGIRLQTEQENSAAQRSPANLQRVKEFKKKKDKNRVAKSSAVPDAAKKSTRFTSDPAVQQALDRLDQVANDEQSSNRVTEQDLYLENLDQNF